MGGTPLLIGPVEKGKHVVPGRGKAEQRKRGEEEELAPGQGILHRPSPSPSAEEGFLLHNHAEGLASEDHGRGHVPGEDGEGADVCLEIHSNK